MRALISTKIAKGTLAREHVLKIFDHLSTLEILDDETDAES